jgi:hypothetical protein
MLWTLCRGCSESYAEDALEVFYDNLLSDDVMLKYPNFTKYVEDVYEDQGWKKYFIFWDRNAKCENFL